MYVGPVEAFWRSFAVTLGKRWTTVAVVVGVVTVVLGIGATRVEFATGQDSYLNPDSRLRSTTASSRASSVVKP